MLCAVQKPYLLILVNLQSNKRHKKDTLRFPIDFSPITVKFPIPTKNIESLSHFLAFLINHLV